MVDPDTLDRVIAGPTSFPSHVLRDVAEELRDRRAAEATKCGSLRVLRWVDGYMAEVVYCQRTGGPCLWPGSDYGGPKPPSEHVRQCAADA